MLKQFHFVKDVTVGFGNRKGYFHLSLLLTHGPANDVGYACIALGFRIDVIRCEACIGLISFGCFTAAIFLTIWVESGWKLRVCCYSRWHFPNRYAPEVCDLRSRGKAT